MPYLGLSPWCVAAGGVSEMMGIPYEGGLWHPTSVALPPSATYVSGPGHQVSPPCSAPEFPAVLSA